jgi:hypothetical protein
MPETDQGFEALLVREAAISGSVDKHVHADIDLGQVICSSRNPCGH